MTTEAQIDEQIRDEQAITQSGLRRLATGNAAYIFVIDLVLILCFTLLSRNHVFFSWLNATSMMSAIAEALLLAAGLTMMLSAGMFDLSLGANLILSSVCGALVVRQLHGAPSLWVVLLPLLACVAAGLVFGLVNGVIIAYLRVNSLIATLGTLGIGTGFAFVITHGSDFAEFPPALESFGATVWFHIPVVTFVGLAGCLVLWAVLRYTRYGLRTLTIGSNAAAAERNGLQVRPHLVSLAVLTGGLAGLSGFLDLGLFGATNTGGHTLDALTALTAAVIGGTSLSGGRASMFGTVWGTVLGILLLNGLVVLDVQSFYQQVATGVILIVAVAVDGMRYRRRE